MKPAKMADVGAAVDAVEISEQGATPERDEQFAAAKAAVKALILSGAVGSEGPFTASLSGHANPGHLLVAGYANDCIYVSVQRVAEPVAELAAEPVDQG